MMTGNADTNSELSNTLPLLHAILSVAGRVNSSQIVIQRIPIATIEYDGENFSVVEGNEYLKQSLVEIFENLDDLDFFNDLSIAIRFRRVVANSNSI
jgi:hypothetical protein